MKIKINSPKSTEIFYEGKFYKTNEEIEVNFGEGQRLSRLFGTAFSQKMEKYDLSIFKDRGEFVFQSDIDTVSGWGNVSLNLIKYSSKE